MGESELWETFHATRVENASAAETGIENLETESPCDQTGGAATSPTKRIHATVVKWTGERVVDLSIQTSSRRYQQAQSQEISQANARQTPIASHNLTKIIKSTADNSI